MAEAARQVLDELHRLPISAIDSRAKGGRIITLRAMARCVWRSDIYTAQKLNATTADGERFLRQANGVVAPLDRRVRPRRARRQLRLRTDGGQTC
eukprot:7513807-Pyramimonas_sp.AAC.1